MFKTKDGQLIDFECDSPIKSGKNVKEKQFLFDEAPGSEESEDTDSDFEIKDEVEPQRDEAFFPVTVSEILKHEPHS
jgi:hypothetical protein